MLPKALVDEVNRLLHEGKLSQRKIAGRLGVSRATVSAIASGRRGLYGREPEGERTLGRGGSPPARCPRCGYRVYMPCLVCRSRDYRREQQLAAVVPAQSRSAWKRLQRSGARQPLRERAAG